MKLSHWLSFLQDEDRFSKDSDIVRAITANVATRCGCTFTNDRITERNFQCFPSSPQAVTYRARLDGTRGATVADLLQDIEEWIEDGASFPVQLQLLTVDSSCSVGIGSFTESECTANSVTTSSTEPTSNSNDRGHTSDSSTTNTGAIIGAVVAAVFILVLITAIVVIVVIICRKRLDLK